MEKVNYQKLQEGQFIILECKEEEYRTYFQIGKLINFTNGDFEMISDIQPNPTPQNFTLKDCGTLKTESSKNGEWREALNNFGTYTGFYILNEKIIQELIKKTQSE